MAQSRLALVPAHVERTILLLRGERVILDADLATLYGVETRSLVQAVKRNSSDSLAISCFSSPRTRPRT